MNERHRWADSLALGHEEMDREHEYQIGLVESLAVGLSDSGDAESAQKTLDALVDFTSVHFMAEEVLMRELAYPGYEAHVGEHHNLMTHIVKLRTSLESGARIDALGFVGSIRDWLSRHIDSMDRPFARFLERRRTPAGV